jgi:hypothetical protein
MRIINLILIGIIMTVIGCATPKHEGAFSGTQPEGFKIPYNTVVILGKGLADSLAIENSEATRTETNTLSVRTTIRNRTDGKISVSIRSHFFDGEYSGLEVSAWTPIFLEPRSVYPYGTSSKDQAAMFWYIEVSPGTL